MFFEAAHLLMPLLKCRLFVGSVRNELRLVEALEEAVQNTAGLLDEVYLQGR